MSGATRKIVIAGLDPAIHRAKRIFEFLMDARVKPAHDGLEMGRPS
jgi:hypothetical protein